MRVIILCKAPIAGCVKTRLMSKYTAQEAAELHEKMARTVVSKVCSQFTDVWLAVDHAQHAFFQSLQAQFHVELHQQGSGDLGERMKYLSDLSFSQDSQSVMFLGTDSPHVSVQRYLDAEASLQLSHVVLGPVEDGGYDLIALKSFTPHVFDNIDWGTEHVLVKTMSNIKELRCFVNVISMSFDLDTPKDLERAPVHTW